jgi:hypothetical protein
LNAWSQAEKCELLAMMTSHDLMLKDHSWNTMAEYAHHLSCEL